MTVVGGGGGVPSRPWFTRPTSHYPWDTHRKAGMGVARQGSLLSRHCRLSPFLLWLSGSCHRPGPASLRSMPSG